MTNWLSCPTLTKELALDWVQNVLEQDIEVKLLVWVNGSEETTKALAEVRDPRLHTIHSETNIGVGPAWNQICQIVYGGILGDPGEHVLITNDDVKLRPDTYRQLLIPNGGFVTPINVGDWEKCKTASYLVEPEPVMKGGPDFSCFLIKKWFYESVGPFPECYWPAYFEDRHYHMQAIGAGLGSQIYSVTFPYYHEASQTIKRSPAAAALNSEHFEKNKQLFITKWGGPPHAETRTTPNEP